MEQKTVLRLEGIVKQYPGVLALDHVNMDFAAGEIHAIVGENGAGKSTLMKVISGAISPDEGTIEVNGVRHQFMTTELSKQNSISIIYQEFNLVPMLSVAENIYLGSPIKKGIVLDQKAMVMNTAKIFEELKIKIDPQTKIRDLSVAYQQMVEIAKSLSRNAKILIMDEPSAPLTDSEVEIMLDLVVQLRNSGVTILYISHRLDEIFKIADRVSVMRDGQYVTTLNIKDTDKNGLIQLMVGRDLSEQYPDKNAHPGEVALEVKNVWGNGVEDISFELHKGEILGFAGLVGAGRTELAQLLFGVAPMEKGEIYLYGKKFTPKSPRNAIKHKIGLIPEDRKNQGVLLERSIYENISLPSLPSLSKCAVINKKQESIVCEKQKDDLRVKTPSIHQKVKNLSGGNQQKVVLAKWLAADCDLLIFDEPTRGIDVGAKHEIYKLMNDLVEQGKSIIMISSEMEELMGMSDRIVILHEGVKTGEMNRDEFEQDKILAKASN